MLWLHKDAQCTYPWRGWILTSESILVSSVGKPQWQDVRPYVHDCYRIAEVSHELKDTEGWHGSVKPLKVVADLMQRIAALGACIFDPFLGSGTTMIAAEQLKRRCFGIEIEPRYVDVCCRRYMNQAGNSPVRESDGAKFADLIPDGKT